MTLIKKHFRLPPNVAKVFEEEAKRRGISQNALAIEACRRIVKEKALKYKGFEWKIMTYKYTCYKCQEEFEPPHLAMYDTETGACVCDLCGIENEMTSKSSVNRHIKKLRAKRDLKALRKECTQKAQELIELKDKIDIYRLGQNHEALEEKKKKILEWNDDFLRKHLGTKSEVNAIEICKKKIAEVDNLQLHIRKIIARKIVVKPIKN